MKIAKAALYAVIILACISPVTSTADTSMFCNYSLVLESHAIAKRCGRLDVGQDRRYRNLVAAIRGNIVANARGPGVTPEKVRAKLDAYEASVDAHYVGASGYDCKSRDYPGTHKMFDSMTSAKSVDAFLAKLPSIHVDPMKGECL